MAVVVTVAVVPPHVVLVIGALHDGEQQVVLGIVNGVIPIEVFPSLQRQRLAVLFGADEYKAVALIYLVDFVLKFRRALGLLERLLNVIQVDYPGGSVGGGPIFVGRPAAAGCNQRRGDHHAAKGNGCAKPEFSVDQFSPSFRRGRPLLSGGRPSGIGLSTHGRLRAPAPAEAVADSSGLWEKSATVTGNRSLPVPGTRPTP